jgi:hypothetical protein
VVEALLLLQVRALWHGGRKLLIALYGILLGLLFAPLVILGVSAAYSPTSAFTEASSNRVFPVLNFGCVILFYLGVFSLR